MFWKIKAYYLLYFIPIPIFFSAAGIYRGNSLDDNTFALPISLVVFIVVYLFDIKYISVMFEKKTFLLFIMLLYSISIFLLKIIFSGSELNPNLLFISTIPLLVSFCIGYKLKPFLLRDNLTKIVDRVVFIFSLFCIAHLLFSFVSYGVVGAFANRGEDSVWGVFSIYQKLIYYPTMVSCFFILSLFTTLKCRYIYSMIFLLVVFMTGAREALLICMMGIISSFFLNSNKKSLNHILRILAVTMVVALLIIYFIDPISRILESATFLAKLKNLSGNSDITAGRLEAIYAVFSNSADSFNFFIGTGYSMNLGDFRSPHNQYVEVLLRSGTIGLSFFVIFIIGVLRNMHINIKQYRHTTIKYSIYSFMIIYLCLIFISFNVNVPVRVPYTAILFGFLSGFFYNIKTLKQS